MCVCVGGGSLVEGESIAAEAVCFCGGREEAVEATGVTYDVGADGEMVFVAVEPCIFESRHDDGRQFYVRGDKFSFGGCTCTSSLGSSARLSNRKDVP